MYLTEYLCGAITTYCTDAEITDSAAAGTALAAGYKTNKGYIGILPSAKPVASILEASQLLGKATGMVTTYDWSNATPAAFSAHDISRSNNIVISEQIVNQDIDVVLGVGFDLAFAGVEEAEKRGYDVINNRADLNAVEKGDKIWGNLEQKSFPYDINNTETTVTLAEMTKAAITALSDSSEDGFFLMVEGSQVDGGGHSNNAQAMVGEYLAFDEAFSIAVEYAKGRNDTVVIACPDHDTGGMNLPDDLIAAAEELRNGNQPSDVTWTKTGHTDRNGGLFIYIPEGISYPDGIDMASQNPFEDNVIDNADIIPYLAGLIGADMQEATDKLFVDVTDMGRYDAGTRQFIFNDYPVSVIRNASYAFADGKRIYMDGQIAVWIEGRFYVPQILLDIMENGSYDDNLLGFNQSPVYSSLNVTMPSPDDISANLTLNNYFTDASVSGYVEFKKPEAFAALGKINIGEIKGGEEKTIPIDCKEINKNGCDFVYDIVLDNGEKYEFSQEFGGTGIASSSGYSDDKYDPWDWHWTQETFDDPMYTSVNTAQSLASTYATRSIRFYAYRSDIESKTADFILVLSGPGSPGNSSPLFMYDSQLQVYDEKNEEIVTKLIGYVGGVKTELAVDPAYTADTKIATLQKGDVFTYGTNALGRLSRVWEIVKHKVDATSGEKKYALRSVRESGGNDTLKKRIDDNSLKMSSGVVFGYVLERVGDLINMKNIDLTNGVGNDKQATEKSYSDIKTDSGYEVWIRIPESTPVVVYDPKADEQVYAGTYDEILGGGKKSFIGIRYGSNTTIQEIVVFNEDF